MVATVVPELELVGLAAERQPDQLMPKADPKDRRTPRQLADVLLRIRHRLRITRPVRQKDPVRIERQHIFGRSLRRNDRYPRAFFREHAQNVLLDSEVVRYYVKMRPLFSLWFGLQQQRIGTILFPLITRLG